MTTFPAPSTTRVFVGGLGLVAEYIASEALYPGDLVEFTNADADDKTIKPCTVDSEEAIGFAIITPNMTLTTGVLTGGKMTQAFVAEDSVKVVKGDAYVMARIAPEQEVTRGALLQPAASGELKLWETGTDTAGNIVAQALDDLTASSDMQWLLVNVRIN